MLAQHVGIQPVQRATHRDHPVCYSPLLMNRSELCLFPRFGNGGFHNEQSEEGSNGRGQHIDVFPSFLVLSLVLVS